MLLFANDSITSDRCDVNLATASVRGPSAAEVAWAISSKILPMSLEGAELCGDQFCNSCNNSP